MQYTFLVDPKLGMVSAIGGHDANSDAEAVAAARVAVRELDTRGTRLAHDDTVIVNNQDGSLVYEGPVSELLHAGQPSGRRPGRYG